MPHPSLSGRCGCGFRGPPDEGMVRMRDVALVVGFLAALAHGLGAQEVVPPLSLSPGPRFEIGSGGLELHRVQGAAFLPGGRRAWWEASVFHGTGGSWGAVMERW
jgi:hypothetical protein